MAMKDQNGMEDRDIHRAAASGDLQELQRLIDEDANAVRASGWFGTKPLHYAARRGSLECVKYLVEKGADVNARCVVNRSTAIFEASTDDIAEWLISQGAELDLISTKGRVPLDYACQGLHEGVVRVLLQHGADPNFRPRTKHFHTMMQWSMTEDWEQQSSYAERCAQIISLLLAHGAEPNATNVFGSTALHKACSLAHVSIVRLLLAHGADPNLRDFNKRSAFDEASNSPEILALLEPLRRDIAEPPKLQQTLEQLIERLLIRNIINENDLRPCSEEDIAELERLHDVILPQSYKTFLLRMGRGAGCFLKSDHWSAFFDDFRDSTDLGGKVELAEEFGLQLPPHSFVFASRLGDVHFYFIADGTTSDPPVYGYSDCGYQGEVYKSFWGFIEELVEYYELYCDPEKF